MAPIGWKLSAHVDASPEDVLAWLCDYREDDHDRPAFHRGAGTPAGKRGGSKRTIVARDGDTVDLEDVWGRRRFRSKVTVDRQRIQLRIAGDFGYQATWTATAEGGGTRLAVEGSVAASGVAGAFLRLAKGSFIRQMEADFAGHVEDLRDSLRADRPPAPDERPAGGEPS